MAVTGFLYTKYLASIHGGLTAAEARSIDYLSDVIKAMLTTNVYTPDRNAHQFKSDITGEVVGVGYAAGGLTLTTKTMVQDLPTFSIRLGAANLVWPGSSFTARRCVFYDDRAALDANKELIGYIDFGVDETVAGASFIINFPAEGIIKHVAG